MKESKYYSQIDRQDNSINYKIQTLRGLAIIAVVFIHNTPNGMSQVIIRPFLNFGVGLFLFLSGMLSNAGKWNPMKRISKVLIPYAIWTLIYVVGFAYKVPLQIPIIYMRKLILGNSAAIMYYIFVYCEFTLLIPLIDKLAKSKYWYWGFVVTPMEIIIMRLIPLILGVGFNKYINAIMGVSCLGWFTYFYLGYMMGNKLIKIQWSDRKLLLIWGLSILFQIGEGYLYLYLGQANCGTQIKLSSIISGALFSIIAFRFIYSNRECHCIVLKKIGDISFGIYFSHIAVMTMLGIFPFYKQLTPYPINAIIVIIATSLCVCVGKNILGKYAKYFAL